MKTMHVFFSRVNVWILFALIFIGGSVLRLYRLGYQSFWNDELSSWRRSNYVSIEAVIAKSAYSDYHPPLYQMILFLVEKYIGDTETILRFPSAISGILSIGMIFLLGARCYSHKEGLIAAALMAVSWAPIYYSQEARSYAILLLFAIIATYTWIPLIRNLRDEHVPPIGQAFHYIVPAVICCYLHYYGVFLVGVHFICMVVALRKKIVLLQGMFMYIIIGVCYLPWLPTMLKHSAKKPSAAFVTPTIHTFEYYIEFLFGKSLTIAIVVLLLFTFLVLYALYVIMKDTQQKLQVSDILSSDYFIAFWFIFPFVIAYTKSTISSPVFTNRNMIICLPAAYLLVARALMLLPLYSWLKYLASGAIVAALLFNLLYTMEYYTTPHKEQFREAVSYVTARDAAYSNSIVISYTWEGSYLDYYLERQGSAKKVSAVAGTQKDIPTMVQAIYAHQPDYIWYVAAHNVPDNAFIDFLLDDFAVLDYKTFNKVQVWLLANPFARSSFRVTAQLECNRHMIRTETEQLFIQVLAMSQPCRSKQPLSVLDAEDQVYTRYLRRQASLVEEESDERVGLVACVDVPARREVSGGPLTLRRELKQTKQENAFGKSGSVYCRRRVLLQSIQVPPFPNAIPTISSIFTSS